MPSAAACVVACTAPMPPNATRSSRRGSAPASDSTRRTASVMCASTSATTAAAVASTSRPVGRPTASSARRAASASRRRRPPQNAPASRRPSTRSASVTVGLGPAPSVADRPRLRAGRFGPDVQDAVLDPRDRSAAGSDRHDVDHRQRDAVAVAPVPVAAQLGAPVADEAHVVARAAHVDGDHVAEPGRGRGARRGDHAAGRSRTDRGDGSAPDHGGRRDAAGRRCDQQLGGVPDPASRASSRSR